MHSLGKINANIWGYFALIWQYQSHIESITKNHYELFITFIYHFYNNEDECVFGANRPAAPSVRCVNQVV